MHPFLIDMLACPACRGELTWHITEQDHTHIETAEATCKNCGSRYPVREGIGIFLTADLPREDLWEEVESHIASHLQDHPEIERKLMGSPLKDLSPADQFFRAMILDERGAFEQAKAAFEVANLELYTPAYLDCCEAQIAFLLEKLSDCRGPIIDLASGMGQLVERMAKELTPQVVATDFSLRVLRQDRKRFTHAGLDERISLIACDAHRMPFRNDSVGMLTTYLGLANIRQPLELLRELHRIVNGTLMAIMHFFPEDDPENREVIRDLGLADLLYRDIALKAFDQTDWRATLMNACEGIARPTPSGVILEGAKIDGLPAAETMLEWGVIKATRKRSGFS